MNKHHPVTHLVNIPTPHGYCKLERRYVWFGH